MWFGAVFGCCKSYGAVRYCDISYGAVLERFSEFVNATVRFGAVFRCREPYGAVRLFYVLRCGSARFSNIVKPTVRCGSVLKRAKILRCGSVRFEPHRTDRKKRTVKNPEI